MGRGSTVSSNCLDSKRQKLADEVVRVEAAEEVEKTDRALGELLDFAVSNFHLIGKFLKYGILLSQGKDTVPTQFPKT